MKFLTFAGSIPLISRRMCLLLAIAAIALVALMIVPRVAEAGSHPPNTLENGGFETGNLSGCTLFNTPSVFHCHLRIFGFCVFQENHIARMVANVVPHDTVAGTPSLGARILVGQDNFTVGFADVPSGGGMFQTVIISHPSNVTLSVDLAEHDVFDFISGVERCDRVELMCWQSAQVGQIRTREGYYYEELRGSSLRVLL